MSHRAVRYIVRYTGHVQGVCFRATAVSQAFGLDINGVVRNEPDGSVKMEVEGTVADLKELMRRIASEMCGFIEGVDVDQRPPRGIDSGFRIQY